MNNTNEALEYYISGEGMFVNQALRGNVGSDFGELSDSEKEFIKDLDAVTKNKLGAEQILYRSIDASVLFNNLSTSEYQALIDNLAYNDNQAYTKRIAESGMKKLKSSYNEKGFMSTTTSREYAEDFRDFTGAENPVVMRIKTSKNTKGVNIGKKYPALERRMQQKEVLLGRNQSGKIKRVYGKNGTLYVDIDMN